LTLQNATTLIDYFQQSGGRSIGEMENPAEYMLEIIGAGATAKTDVDWHEKWKTSSEAQSVQDEIEHIHADGRQKPPVEATLRSSFATNWVYQVKTLTARNAQYFWRDPTYIFSKLALNIVGGLFIGFTFFQAVSTQQGTQNKLFVSRPCCAVEGPD
jgi:ATP-binding cassette subfamily G (WHITE) protein 2 (SNQ2)